MSGESPAMSNAAGVNVVAAVTIRAFSLVARDATPERGGDEKSERRALRLDVVVDHAVVAAVNDAVEIEVAVEVAERVGHLDEVVDDAVVAAVDHAIQI